MGEKIERNDSKVNQTIVSILNHLKEGEKSLEYPTEERSNVVLLLGNTGAGKSTLLHYIAKDNTKLISKEVINPRSGKSTGHFIIEDTEAKIGRNVIKSHTHIPESVFDPNTKTSFYDCPGFEDNRNATYDVAGTYFIKKITDRAKFIKFIIVANYNSVAVSGDKSDFLILARHVTDMIKNIHKFKSAVCLVASKVNDAKPDETILENIASYLYSARDELSNSPLAEGKLNEKQRSEIIKFIDVLLEKKGDDYMNLGFIRQPTVAGPISNITAMQNHKLSLLKLVHENINFVRHDDPAELAYTISSDSRNYVGNLMHEIYKQIDNNIDAIAYQVKQYYDDLILAMVNTMNSFVNGTVIAEVNPPDAQVFVEKLNGGKNRVEKLTNEIQNITEPIELSRKLVSTFTNWDIKKDGISGCTSTIMTVGDFLIFLRSFHNSTWPTQQWTEVFKAATTHIVMSAERFQKNAINVKNQLEKKIKAEMTQSADAIKVHFTNKEAKIHDIKQLFREIEAAYQLLLKINETANAKQCVNRISDSLTAVNFDTSDIMKHANYLEYMKNLAKTNGPSDNAFKCIEVLELVNEYLSGTKRWYFFLSQLYSRLSEYEVQRDIKKYDTITNESFGNYVNRAIGSTNFKTYLESCCNNLYHVMYNQIEHVVLNNSKVNALKNLMALTLKSNINMSCEGNTLVVKGQFVKMSDVINKYCNRPIKFIEIFALNKIFFDTGLKKPGAQLSIIAPIWEVPRGYQEIILDGKDGEAQMKAKTRANRDPHGRVPNGEDGAPGNPGDPGGNFVGFGDSCIQCQDLRISVNGGKGGAGQDGGDGGNGINSDEIMELSVSSDVLKNPFPSFNSKRYKINLEQKKKIKIAEERDRIFWITYNRRKYYNGVEVYAVYKDAESGGNAGDGGCGGIGGNAGSISVQFSNPVDINIVKNRGEVGSKGFGGSGGKAGKDNELMLIKMSMTSEEDDDVHYISDRYDIIKNNELQFNVRESNQVDYEMWRLKIWHEIVKGRCYWYTLDGVLQNGCHNSQAKSGLNGKTGIITKGILQPEKPYLVNASPSTDSFQKYSMQYQNGSIRELDMKNFSNQLDRMKGQNHYRKHRHATNNDNESYTKIYNSSTAAKNSAAKLTSPLNHAFNWLSGGLEHLKFWASSHVSKADINKFTFSKLEILGNDRAKEDAVTSLNCNFNINGFLFLTDFIIKYFTKVKSYNKSIEKPVDSLEIKAYVLDIVDKFETLLNNEFYTSEIHVEFDPIGLIGKLETEIINGNFNKISEILYHSILINGDSGTLKFDECLFSAQIRNKIEEMLEQRDDFLHGEQFVTGNLSDNVKTLIEVNDKISTNDNFFISQSNTNLIE